MEKIPFNAYDFFAYLSSGFLLLTAFDISFHIRLIIRQPFPFGLAVALLIFAYVLGHVVAQLSSLLLESFLLRRVLFSPEDHMLDLKAKSWRNFLFPLNSKPLPEDTLNRIREQARRAGVTPSGRGFFFHCNELAKGNSVTRGRLDNFLNLYGFCRNVSMSFLLSAGLFFVTGLLLPFPYSVGQPYLSFFSLAGSCLILSAIMFYRYLKFFRNYTQEVLVTYSETKGTG